MKGKSDLSFGIIPLRQFESSWHLLLVQHRNGKHYSFPKGHSESGESPQATARRELKEETGLEVVKLLLQEPLFESYCFKQAGMLIRKKVGYFPAEVSGSLSLQVEEIESAIWAPLTKAIDYITFAEGKALCQNLMALLPNLTSR